jgi:heat shock protein HslJ
MIRTALRLLPAAVVAMVLAATACTAPPPPAPDRADPTGTYVVTGYMNAGDGLSAPVPGTTITLQIGADGQLSGRVCNSYGASWTTAGSAFTIGPVMATKKYCTGPAGLMEQESAYFTALAAARTWQATEATLTLSYSGGTAVIADRAS